MFKYPSILSFDSAVRGSSRHATLIRNLRNFHGLRHVPCNSPSVSSCQCNRTWSFPLAPMMMFMPSSRSIRTLRCTAVKTAATGVRVSGAVALSASMRAAGVDMRIDVPTKGPTCVTLGRPTLSDLFITTLRVHHSAQELEAVPNTGGLFSAPAQLAACRNRSAHCESPVAGKHWGSIADGNYFRGACVPGQQFLFKYQMHDRLQRQQRCTETSPSSPSARSRSRATGLHTVWIRRSEAGGRG